MQQANENLPGNETIIRVEAPPTRYTLLVDADGLFLTDAEPQSFVDDRAIWQTADDDGYRHIISDKHLAPGADIVAARGPHALPSELLAEFRHQGWICLPALIEPSLVAAIQRVATVGDWEGEKFDRAHTPLLQDAAIAKVAVEPVSLWLMREYMQTQGIRLAHSPSLAVIGKDDGKRDVQGWHSDFPYLWGITRRVGGNRIPTEVSGDLVLGIQRNVCISDFTSEYGATAFKLGTHNLNQGPPEEWGIGADYSKPGYRAEHGLPYGGKEAQVVEAPCGSVILYDARTWHRQGVNTLPAKRAAMLQAVTPNYVMPFSDTTADFRNFSASPLAQELSQRERDELEEVLLHRVVGPGGSYVIRPEAAESAG